MTEIHQNTPARQEPELALDYNTPGVPPELVEVLDTRLAPLVESMNSELVLKGGLAVAVYLTSDLCGFERTVSPDIDWTMRNSQHDLEASRVAIEQLCGMACEYKDAMAKPVFHSYKISAETTAQNGNTVELDAIAISRVQPGNTGFSFEFTLDESAYADTREVAIPGGKTVRIVSPELLVAEKLLAGRGPELGKLDYFDTAGLLVTQQIDPEKMHAIAEMQKYDPAIDHNLPPELQNSEAKKADFIDKLVAASYQLEAALDTPLTLIPGEPGIADVFGKEAVLEATARFRGNHREEE